MVDEHLDQHIIVHNDAQQQKKIRVNPVVMGSDLSMLAQLVRKNCEGELPDCIVTGPLALDNCLFREAAIHKGIEDPNAGKTDILLAPEIETGNALYKSFAFVMKATCAGVIVGASAPVILTSRADREETKLNSIALAMRIAYERMN